MSRFVFRRCSAAAFVVAAACVPTEFTFLGEGGAGAGPGGGGGTGGDPNLACGDGVQQRDEGCDAGEQNSDDFSDVSYATELGTDAGCSRACEPVIAWSWNYAVESEASAIFGLAVTANTVYAGGVIAPDPLDLVDVHYGGTRLYVELDPLTGAELAVVAQNDAGESNAIFGVRVRDEESVWVLENRHHPDPPSELGSYVSIWSGGAELAGSESDYVGRYEGSYAYLGYPGSSDPRLHVIASRDSGIIRIARVDDQGTVEIDEGLTGFGGQGGPGAITPRLAGGSYAVWRGRLRLYSDEIVQQYELDLRDSVEGAEVVMVTGACTRPDGSAAFSAWAREPTTGVITAAVLVADEFDGVVFVDTWEGPAPGPDRAHAIACGPDGSFVVAGEESVLSAGDPGVLNDAYSRAFVRKYTSPAEQADPVLAWHRTHQSPITNASETVGSNDAYAVAIGPDGAVYVAGREMTSQSGGSAWIRRYAP